MPSTNGHGSENSERVALYMRVSSEEQRDRETIEIQREFLEQYCRLYRLEIAKMYADDGVSGTVPLHERPDGRQLLEDAREGRFTAVLVSKLDRLGPCSSSSTLTTASTRPGQPCVPDANP
jgi:site-specific DNA recombinase